MNEIMKPIIADAFAAANASATLFNTIANQWQVARDAGCHDSLRWRQD